MKLGKLALPQLLGLLVLVGTAAAAVTVTYTDHSTLTLGVRAAPIVFAAGTDAAPSDYVPSFSLTTNATAYTASLRGVPAATVTIDDLVDVKNVDAHAHTVTLAATSDANALVTTYRIDLVDGSGGTVATLDLKASAPSATVALAGGETLHARVTITLASGAGADNVADTTTVTTSVAG
jgi:hypothetical protein